MVNTRALGAGCWPPGWARPAGLPYLLTTFIYLLLPQTSCTILDAYINCIQFI